GTRLTNRRSRILKPPTSERRTPPYPGLSMTQTVNRTADEAVVDRAEHASEQESSEARAGQRLLGLPSVARLSLFARHDGPAVLLTTAERITTFTDTLVFGAPSSVEPGLDDWSERERKVVIR